MGGYHFWMQVVVSVGWIGVDAFWRVMRGVWGLQKKRRPSRKDSPTPLEMTAKDFRHWRIPEESLLGQPGVALYRTGPAGGRHCPQWVWPERTRGMSASAAGGSHVGM